VRGLGWDFTLAPSGFMGKIRLVLQENDSSSSSSSSSLSFFFFFFVCVCLCVCVKTKTIQNKKTREEQKYLQAIYLPAGGLAYN